jgi:hypothetical protein
MIMISSLSYELILMGGYFLICCLPDQAKSRLWDDIGLGQHGSP